MRLKILAEGSTRGQHFIKHWGLSVLINNDILFDTFGKPNYVLKQLKRFKIDINKIKDIIISHDDWDHVTGLWKILERDNDVTVYICPRFSPDIKARIKWYGARFVEVDKLTEIRSNIYLSGELQGGSRGGVALPEQYLAIKTPKGMVIITGCAHPGILEIVQHAKVSFNSEICMLIGGFHLKDNSDEANSGIVTKLKGLGVHKVMPLHCTGKVAEGAFLKIYGNDCIIIGEGQAIDIEETMKDKSIDANRFH